MIDIDEDQDAEDLVCPECGCDVDLDACLGGCGCEDTYVYGGDNDWDEEDWDDGGADDELEAWCDQAVRE